MTPDEQDACCEAQRIMRLPERESRVALKRALPLTRALVELLPELNKLHSQDKAEAIAIKQYRRSVNQ